MQKGAMNWMYNETFCMQALWWTAACSSQQTVLHMWQPNGKFVQGRNHSQPNKTCRFY